MTFFNPVVKTGLTSFSGRVGTRAKNFVRLRGIDVLESH